MKPPLAARMPAGWTATLTPMIDVVLLLLIFFLCTLAFGKPQGSLPTPLAVERDGEGRADPEKDEEWVRIDLEIEGVQLRIHLAGQHMMDQAMLVERLRRLRETGEPMPIILAPRGDVPLSTIVMIMDRCREVGFGAIQLLTRPSPANSVHPPGNGE